MTQKEWDSSDEAQLIAATQKGDHDAFAFLMRLYKDRVFNTALRFVGNWAIAEELTQDVFVSVYRNIGGFKGESKFSTWLYRVTWNLCTDWLRRNRRPDRRTEAVDEADALPDKRVDLEGEVLEEEQRVAVRDALDRLDEKYRSVIVLHYYQKLSYDQIAAVLDMPAKTVETRLYRARKALRESLESSGRGGDA